MKISITDAFDLFDHFCFIDLKEQMYYPSMKLAKLKNISTDLTHIDYSKMEKEKNRYLRPPVRNPMYIDFHAALRSGISSDKLIEFGYHESDAEQKFLTQEEGLLLCEEGPTQAASDAMHVLRSYLFETNRYSAFLSNWKDIHMNTVKDWLLQYDIEIE